MNVHTPITAPDAAPDMVRKVQSNSRFALHTERIQTAIDLWAKGLPLIEIADAIEVSEGQLKAISSRHREAFPARSRNKARIFTKVEIAQMAEMWVAGKTANQLRKIYQTSTGTIEAVVEKHPDLFPPRHEELAGREIIAQRGENDPKFEKRIKALLRCRTPKAQIAKEMGITHSQVDGFARDHGFDLALKRDDSGLRADGDFALSPQLAARNMPVSFVDVRDSECKFMEGESLICCGCATVVEKRGSRSVRSAYCAEHLKIVRAG